MSNFFQKFAQGPKSGLKLAEGIKTNLGDKIKPSFLSHAKDFLTNKCLPKMPNIPMPNLPEIPMPNMPDIPMPHIPKIPMPNLPHISMPHLPNVNMPGLSKILSMIPDIPYLKVILMAICGAIYGLIALITMIAAVVGSIAAPGIVLPILGVLAAGGIVVIIIVVILIILWYFFLNDRDITLGVIEYFGKGKKKYSGKVVWIVGASTSLGQAIALELAKVGAKLILSARRKEILKALKTECIEISKGKLSDSDILVLPFAVTEMDEKYIEDVIEHFGKLDVLIDNISHIELGEACKTSIGMDKAIFDVNFFGPVFFIKNALNHFKEAEGGQIIVVSSISGKFGIPCQAAASASKQALHIYLETLRLECAGHKIYITTICPGLILSSVTDHSVLVGTSLISQDEQLKMTRKGLNTKRCARLIVVAGANRCTECWVSNQPFLFLMYMAQYNPWIHRLIMKFILPAKRLELIYEGKSPNIWMWRPLFVI